MVLCTTAFSVKGTKTMNQKRFRLVVKHGDGQTTTMHLATSKLSAALKIAENTSRNDECELDLMVTGDSKAVATFVKGIKS